MEKVQKILATKLGQELLTVIIFAIIVNIICVVFKVNTTLVDLIFFVSVMGIFIVHLYDWWTKSEIREVLATVGLSKWGKIGILIGIVSFILTIIKMIYLGPH